MANHVNNNAYLVMREAYAQITGREDLDTFSLKDVIDSACDASIDGYKEMFANTLLGKIYKTIAVGNNSEYKGKLSDVFSVTKEEWGGMVEVYDIIPADIQENPAWNAIVSGTTTLNGNKVWLSTTKSQLYGKSVAWSIPVVWTDIQLKEAFLNEEGLMSFYNYLMLTVRNSITKHKEMMLRESLNNFIATKVKYASMSGAEGVHVVDLNKAWCEFNGGTSGETFTVEDFRNSPKALLFAQALQNYIFDDLQEFTTKYNVGGYDRFTAPSDLTFIVNSMWDSDMKRIALADGSWDKSFMEGRNKITLPAWQSASTNDFDDITHIKVKVDYDFNADGSHGATRSEATVDVGHVLGVALDKRCLASVLVDEYVGTERDSIKRLTLNQYEFTSRFLNNLTLNAVIFVANDYVFA